MNFIIKGGIIVLFRDLFLSAEGHISSRNTGFHGRNSSRLNTYRFFFYISVTLRFTFFFGFILLTYGCIEDVILS